jgi:hypothetical protein
MNINEVLEIRPKGEVVEGVWVPWNDEEDSPEFQLSYMGRDLITKARKKALTRMLDKKQHRFVDEVDEDKFDKYLMKLSVKSFRNLKVKHLVEILDPTKTELKASPDMDEKEVDFSDINLQVILDNYNLAFSRFVSSVSLEVETYRQYKEEEARKNSESSQAGQ